MSPRRRRFAIELAVGRTLATSIDADSPEIALAIAEHMFTRWGTEPFAVGPDVLIDIEIVDNEEVAS